MHATPLGRERRGRNEGFLCRGTWNPWIQRALADVQKQNFVSPSTVRDITSLRSDLLGALSSIEFVPFGSRPSDPSLNANSANQNLVKAVILGGLWPRVARVSLPQSAIKFDKVQAGSEL